MKDLGDILAVIIMILGLWFVIDPYGMGQSVQKHVNQFQNGLNWNGWE